jgi:small subunit ribosomal protein S1
LKGNEHRLAEKTNDTAVPTSKMAELLASEKFAPRSLSRGQIIEGKVVSKRSGEVLVDIGAKAEGIISGAEIDDGEDQFEALKPGDIVLAYVLQAENESGQAILSLKKAVGEKKWRHLIERYEKSESVEVQGLETNKGGLVVDVEGVRGFIPSSHLNMSVSDAIGKKFDAKVLEIDRKTAKLVLSQRGPLSDAEKEKRKKELENFSKDQVLKGVVTRVAPFGVFVKLSDGLEGLVHISEMSWERVNDPGELFKVGEDIEVKVLGVDMEAGKVNLSVKRLTSSPWENIEEKFYPGKKVKGAINKITPYGIFVNLASGIDGLIHSSKIPSDHGYKVGDEVEASVESITPETRRLSLKLPQS